MRVFSFPFFFIVLTTVTSWLRGPAPGDGQIIRTGEVGYWWAEEGLNTLRQQAEKLDEVVLYIYGLDESGLVVRGDRIASEVEDEMLKISNEKGLRAWLGVNDFENPSLTEKLLNDKEIRRRHITSVLAAMEGRYDGVVIDYEGLPDGSAEAFTDYIKELTEAVHDEGGQTGVTAVPQIGSRTWLNIDVKRVARIVDKFELQGYQEYSENTGAGPVASADWVRQAVESALALRVPPENLLLGSAFTSNEWVKGEPDEFVSNASTRDRLRQLDEAGRVLEWDADAQAYRAVWRDEEGREHVVWLEEARSALVKEDIAREYGLRGVFYWFLGGEDELLWEELSSPSYSPTSDIE